jgi:hypothetical protein
LDVRRDVDATGRTKRRADAAITPTTCVGVAPSGLGMARAGFCVPCLVILVIGDEGDVRNRIHAAIRQLDWNGRFVRHAIEESAATDGSEKKGQSKPGRRFHSQTPPALD